MFKQTNDDKIETSPLTAEFHSHQLRRFSLRVLVAAVVVAVLVGSLGSLGVLAYAVRLPAVQKYFHSGFTDVPNQTTVKQNIVVNEESVITDVVKKASPAVVSIVISRDLSKIPGYGTSPFENDFFSPFFSRPGQETPQEPNIQQVGAGTGFLVSEDGLILTNKHVVSDEQASYTVITSEGKSFDARVLARDPVNDLAIVKVEMKNVPKLELASSDPQVGQRVIAIGNSLGQYDNTVTTGVVSGIGRSIIAGGNGGSEQLEGVIQTDAAINPGNSGGPLLSVTGEVIGINTAIDREGQAVGFAIPAADAMKALASFQKNGSITRPFLGIRYTLITPALAKQENLPKDYGALIIRGNTVRDLAVVVGSPAEKAGLAEGDIILEVDRVKIDSKTSLTKVLKKYNPGDSVSLKVFSKDKERTVKVTLGEIK